MHPTDHTAHPDVPRRSPARTALIVLLVLVALAVAGGLHAVGVLPPGG